MSITAMKQALEALTRIWEDGLENFPESGHDAAITALRTAIAEAEKQEPVAWMDASETALSWENYLDCMKPLYTTPPAAQPEQEPVWDASAPIVMTPHPAFAKRQWVGLTDEEIDEWTPEIHSVIQAIEAKLKEKNT